MADAIAFQIAEAVLQRLSPLAVEVELSPSGEAQSFPALLIDDEGEQILQQDWQTVRARLLLSVEGSVLGGGADGQRTARNLDAAMVAALMADQSLGGLATLINLGAATFQRVKLASKPGVQFQRQLDIEFSYLTTDPTAIGG
jgi:hypothetical protein